MEVGHKQVHAEKERSGPWVSDQKAGLRKMSQCKRLDGLGSPRGEETGKVRHGIRAEDAKGKLKPLPNLPKSTTGFQKAHAVYY